MSKNPNCRFCDALSAVYDKTSVVELRDVLIKGTDKTQQVLFIGGVVPTDQQIEELFNEVLLFEKTMLFRLLTETVRAQGVELGIKNAKDYDQLLIAKAMLHVVGVQESVLPAIRKERAIRKPEKGV